MYRFKPSLRFIKSNSYKYKPSRHFSNQTHLDIFGPMASHLQSRSVIRFQGPDTVKFLQGLLTNDVRRFCEPIGEETSNLPTPNVSRVSDKSMYAAMLTPQGRFLYDMFLYRPSRSYEKLDSTGSRPGSDSDESFELFMDVDVSVLDEILQSWKRYRLRSKVDIENVAQDFSCWQRYGGNLSVKSSSTEEPEAASVGYGASSDPSAMSASQGINVGLQWFNDPRLDCLGFRGIFPSDTIPPLVEADKETTEENYLLWRLEKGVAEGSTEIPKGEAIPLEFNLVGLNAIGFDKGCYVGQEFIARTHHRGIIRKRLLPLKFIDNNGNELEQKVSPGSEVIDTSSGKKVGNVTSTLGSRGLGVLRLDEVFKRSGALVIGGQDDVKVQATGPEWWPSEWLQEHEEHMSAA